MRMYPSSFLTLFIISKPAYSTTYYDSISPQIISQKDSHVGKMIQRDIECALDAPIRSCLCSQLLKHDASLRHKTQDPSFYGHPSISMVTQMLEWSPFLCTMAVNLVSVGDHGLAWPDPLDHHALLGWFTSLAKCKDRCPLLKSIKGIQKTTAPCKAGFVLKLLPFPCSLLVLRWYSW
jgi:hypothetical protein